MNVGRNVDGQVFYGVREALPRAIIAEFFQTKPVTNIFEGGQKIVVALL